MARYKLTLAYDGSGFAGSQRQAATKARTVQGELEKALRTLGWTARSVILSGRTDTGVHATGQVASADLDWSHAEGDLVRALNSALPSDVAVWAAAVVEDTFHPRFDATARRYRYSLFCQSLRDPIRERFAWRVQPAIKPELLATAAELLMGTHDFSAFGSPTTPKGTTVRTVSKAGWKRAAEDGTWQFEVQADAFLYRMVRRMVFVQIAVAQGKIPAEALADALAKQLPVSPEPSRHLHLPDTDPSGPAEVLLKQEGVAQVQARAKARSRLPSGLAPAHGLTLVEVTY